MTRPAQFCAALLLAATPALAQPALAQSTPTPSTPAQDQQPAPFRRLPLQNDAYPGPAHSTQMLMVEVMPGALIPRHTHPGVEMAYMVEGEAELEVQGQPARRVKAGESYHVPAGVPHLLRNGAAPSRIAVTYVVERDKPLASPAP